MTGSRLGWSLPIRNPLQLMIAALPITSSTTYGSSRSARKLSTRSGEYSRTPPSSAAAGDPRHQPRAGPRVGDPPGRGKNGPPQPRIVEYRAGFEPLGDGRAPERGNHGRCPLESRVRQRGDPVGNRVLVGYPEVEIGNSEWLEQLIDHELPERAMPGVGAPHHFAENPSVGVGEV